MQATLDLDADILAAAEEISLRTQRSAGQVLSDLARKALTLAEPNVLAPVMVNGFEVIPRTDQIITAELVQRLMDETE